MKATKNEFPNPVLAEGRDDYSDSCFFHTDFDVEAITVSADSINIPISYSLSCNGLSSLINNGKAGVIVSVKSSAASYSRLFKFGAESNEMTISIPKYDVVKRIDIAGSVIATESIGKFSCPGEFNVIYFGNQTFDIRKGDILATENPRVIYIDDSELEKPISSIFTINKVSNQSDDIVPDFSGEKIEINLVDSLYDLYYTFRDFNNGVLHRYITGIIVYPVLVEAIQKIVSSYSDDSGDIYSDKRWFRAIQKKAEEKNINLANYGDSYTTLADMLLGNIAQDALESFRQSFFNEFNSGETHIIGGVD